MNKRMLSKKKDETICTIDTALFGSYDGVGSESITECGGEGH